jgi:hypothetical protein
MRGTLDGVRYVSSDLIDEAGRLQAEGICPLLGPIRLGLGLGLSSEAYSAPSLTSLHWGGMGGS